MSIIQDIRKKLDSIKNKKKRIEETLDIIHALEFEIRVSALSDEQESHLMNMSLSAAQRKRLDKANKKDRPAIFEEYARCSYFRRCAWSNYLNGITNDPPIGQKFEPDAIKE